MPELFAGELFCLPPFVFPICKKNSLDCLLAHILILKKREVMDLTEIVQLLHSFGTF